MAMATIDTNGDATYDFITPAAFEYQDDALMKLLSPHDNESNHAPLDYDDDTRITISSTTSNNLVCIMGTMAARLSDGDSYKTIHRIRNEAQEGTVVLDVNLRSLRGTPREKCWSLHEVVVVETIIAILLIIGSWRYSN